MNEQQLISINAFKINATPSMVSANFGEMRQIIAKEVSDRVSLVTPETIQPAKTLCADFRKTSKALMAAWKERREVSIADVLKADKEVKELCKLLDDGAEEISAQVKKIEQETKDLCADLLREELLQQWETFGIDPEFRTSEYIDLALLGSINNGKLTKDAKKEIENRAKLDLAKQDKILSRLKELELRCLQNDIVPPLSPASVNHILFADDFDTHLESIIAAEVARKAEAERRMKEKIEREQAAENQRNIEQALKAQQAEANRLAKIEAEKQSDYETYTMTAIITKEFRAEKDGDTGKIERNIAKSFGVEGYSVISVKVKKSGVCDRS